jgi:hypothetical protein
MPIDDKKTKEAAPKKEPVAESKGAEATPKTDGVKTDGLKTEAGKTETGKTEAGKTEATNTDAGRSRKGMGEGQKPVSQAYKDNWNAIFGKKEKKKKR